MPRFAPAWATRKSALMLALGVSSGLPFMLVGNTLGFWLAEAGVRLAMIGFLSWMGLAYSVKFLWGAVVDRLPPPLTAALGRRRGWMLLTQAGVAAGLLGMAASDPARRLAALAAFGVATAICAAAQDTVVDAWRIEIADDDEELGLLTSAYSLGYRLALIATEALILLLADKVGWADSYRVFALAMVVGLVAAALAREPPRADIALANLEAREKADPLARVADAVVGPIRTFFSVHGLAAGLLALLLISSYHLCDYLRGPMSNPFYAALHIPKARIAFTRATLGLGGSLIGIGLGGLSCLRIGVARSLVFGALLQPLAVGSFTLLAGAGGDMTLGRVGGVPIGGFEVVMSFDSLAMAYSGVALTAYMSTLTSLGYTATQYALLTSALTWTGKTLKGFSGMAVEALSAGRSLVEAYGLFYLLAALVGLPAIALCLVAPRPSSEGD